MVVNKYINLGDWEVSKTHPEILLLRLKKDQTVRGGHRIQSLKRNILRAQKDNYLQPFLITNTTIHLKN